MNEIKNKIYRVYHSFQRHAFNTHPRGHSMFQDLDDLISQRENFITYLKFEYSLSIFYNIILAIPSLIYLFTKFGFILKCDPLSTIWLICVSFLKIIEILPKGILIYQTKRISDFSNDPFICTRRLLYMTRSNVFFYNTILGYIMLFLYTFYFLGIRRSNICENAIKFYYIVNWLVFGFFIRLIISFVNYFLHFKYGVNEADIQNNDIYGDMSNKVPASVIEKLEKHLLSNENIKTLTRDDEKEAVFIDCAICLYDFEIGQTIKILPCNRKHMFHDWCVDKWLNRNTKCPTCRKEVNKNSFLKSKIY